MIWNLTLITVSLYKRYSHESWNSLCRGFLNSLQAKDSQNIMPLQEGSGVAQVGVSLQAELMRPGEHASPAIERRDLYHPEPRASPQCGPYFERGRRVERGNTGVAVAEGHVNSAVGNSVGTNDGTSSVRVNKEGDTTTAESSSFITAKEEYFSTRIQSVMESRSSFKTAFESEIQASMEHWSEVPAEVHGGEGSSGEKNLDVFRSLQRQYNIGPGVGFFKDWNDVEWAVGEKIAEGAQSEIFTLETLLLKDADMNHLGVLKVFKLDGWSLQDLQQQWPPGMLLKATTSEHGAYDVGAGFGVGRGMIVVTDHHVSMDVSDASQFL